MSYLMWFFFSKKKILNVFAPSINSNFSRWSNFPQAIPGRSEARKTAKTHVWRPETSLDEPELKVALKTLELPLRLATLNLPISVRVDTSGDGWQSLAGRRGWGGRETQNKVHNLSTGSTGTLRLDKLGVKWVSRLIAHASMWPHRVKLRILRRYHMHLNHTIFLNSLFLM